MSSPVAAPSRPPAHRRVRAAWWVGTLAVVAVGLFSCGLALRLRCRLNGCVWRHDPFFHYFDLNAVNGLPRLFTTALFVAAAVVTWVAAWRVGGAARAWWSAVGIGGVGLAVAKLLSIHSEAKLVDRAATLVGSVALSAVVLPVLLLLARRWRLAAGTPVVGALAVYAVAAVGLDVVSGLLAGMHGGPVLRGVSVFVEELGEALAALLVLATVWWQLPPTVSRARARRR